MNRKQKLKKYFKDNWKVFLLFFISLGVLVSVLCCSNNASKYVNTLDSGTSQVEKKSRIVNDNEIWNDNLIVNSTCFVGYDDWITYNVNDTSSYTFNYVHNDNTKYVNIFLDKSYNNKSCICFMPTPYYNVRIFAVSQDGLYENRLLWVSNGRDRIVSCYVNQAIDHFAIEFQPQETRNITLSFMVCDGVNIPNEYQPYGQIGYTKEYFDETTKNLIQNNKGISLFERFTGLGYYNSQNNLTITDLTSVNAVLDDNKQFFADSYLTRYSQAQSVYLEYLATSQFALRVSDGITFDVNPSISKIYFVINAFDKLENSRNSYYIEFVNPNINNGLTNSIEFDSLIRNSIAKDNQDNYVYMYSTLENGEYRYDYSYDEYTGIKSMRVFINSSNRTNARINATLSQYAEGYNNGYKQGSQEGYNNGVNNVIKNPDIYDLKTNAQYYNYGEQRYQEGIAEDYSIANDLVVVAETPINMTKTILNWDLLGVNLWALFSGLITFGLGLWLVKKVF